MTIGENIKCLRTAFDLSQEEFARIAGVSDGAVSTWERGQNVPRLSTIERIASFFGISKGLIISEGNDMRMFALCHAVSSLPFGGIKTPEHMNTLFVQDMASKQSRLPDDARKILLSLPYEDRIELIKYLTETTDRDMQSEDKDDAEEEQP